MTAASVNTLTAPLLTRSLSRGATDVPLIEQTLGDFFDAMVVRQPEHEALVSAHQRVRYTYRELQAASNQLASALLGLGLAPGDRVGIWSHNNAQWLLMQLATAKVGLILVNINPAYRVAELDYALNKVACKALVTMARFKTSDYVGMLRELAPELSTAQPGALQSVRLPHLRSVVWIDEPGQGDELPGLLRFSALLATGNAADPRLAATAKLLHATDPINIQFTSGTTGFPKGATLTHRNILNNGFFIGEAMKLTPKDRLCIPVPLYHCFGMVLGNLACLTHGATIVYPNDGFDALSVLQTVQDEQCTGLHGVPTMFIAGWMHTGDLATMDAEGYVNIVGRIKDMVIRGGENIYPREIEEFLYRHPQIQDVQVVGIPDAKYGEELCAWIILKQGQTLTEDDIKAFCKGQIAHYKVPRHIRFVSAFPMTVTGKIQKFKIREEMKLQLGLQEDKTA
ncbi:MAG: AMP-binding protein [Rhodoferax sp.]|uniref:AMP-binding protein n=1 Tax=Rhodoferax sp. TaxID=50421 RepID=UPI0017FE9E66|nr:AMP-binding protein [Rhodoferax sp.]NMM14031.1 AMP-binding protein [Rhodoferax sp.]